MPSRVCRINEPAFGFVACPPDRHRQIPPRPNQIQFRFSHRLTYKDAQQKNPRLYSPRQIGKSEEDDFKIPAHPKNHRTISGDQCGNIQASNTYLRRLKVSGFVGNSKPTPPAIRIRSTAVPIRHLFPFAPFRAVGVTDGTPLFFKTQQSLFFELFMSHGHADKATRPKAWRCFGQEQTRRAPEG